MASHYNCRKCNREYKSRQGRNFHEKECSGEKRDDISFEFKNESSLRGELFTCITMIDVMKSNSVPMEAIHREIGITMSMNVQKARDITDEIGKMIEYQQSPEFKKTITKMCNMRSTVSDALLTNELSRVVDNHGNNTAYLQSSIDQIESIVKQKKEELEQLQTCLEITKFTLENIIPHSSSLEAILYVAHEVEKSYRSGIIGEVKGSRVNVTLGSM